MTAPELGAHVEASRDPAVDPVRHAGHEEQHEGREPAILEDHHDDDRDDQEAERR